MQGSDECHFAAFYCCAFWIDYFNAYQINRAKPPLLTGISKKNIGIRIWLDSFVKVKQCDVVTNACPDCNGGSFKPSLNLRHGWVILSYKTIDYPCSDLSLNIFIKRDPGMLAPYLAVTTKICLFYCYCDIRCFIVPENTWSSIGCYCSACRISLIFMMGLL